MRVHLNHRVIALGVVALAPIVAIAVTIARGSRPVPTLEQVTDLARSGRFDEAEAAGSEYLRAFPLDPDIRLVLAEICLSRPGPNPRKALDHLERIPRGTTRLDAWVLVNKGNAYHLQARFDEAERCWSEALRREPSMLEAARRLLDLFGLQGRLEEAHDLVYRQVEQGLDVREQLNLLLRLTRLDVDPPDPWLIVNTFESPVKSGTADLPTTLACGSALMTVSRSHEGLPMLRQATLRHPESAQCWDALLSGLEVAAQRQDVADALSSIPPNLADDVRIARHRGWMEQEAGRWSQAAVFYQRAWLHQRDNAVGYRLRRVLGLAGRAQEAKRVDIEVLDYRDAYKQAGAAIDEASNLLKAGQPIPREFPALMADLRRRMGREREASAWEGLVLSPAAEATNRLLRTP
jgi:tetratricopeptide (TPR) repeat protein